MITGKKFGCFVLSFIHLFIFSTSLLEYNCVTLCWFLLYNKVNQLYIYIHPHYPPSCISLPPSLSHPSRRSQSTQLISLCYAAASHQLSILHLVVYICQCHSVTSSQLTLPSPHVLKSILYICVFITVLPLGSSEPLFLFNSIYMHQHTVFVFLFLTFFTLYDRLQVHPPCYK